MAASPSRTSPASTRPSRTCRRSSSSCAIPANIQRLGGRIPRGVLLVGPPGTGKTLIARAVAGEANVPFFTISGSDFVEMFVGVGASRVRDMFEQAKKNAPCIIFIDEIDAVGRHRGAGLGGGNDEREQTLNQLLVEMDGFEANEGVILIAATNRPDVLDPALLRPGRFDRQVVVPNPDVVGREQILKVHVRKVPLAPDINLKTIARGTPGFSGADLMNLVNEAALTAARRNKRMVTQAEFEEAKDKVMMGAERKSLVMTEEEKMLTAYHEGGHAIVGLNVIATDPIHKATIIPRGRALGMVMQLPERDKLSMSLEQMTSRLAIMMGGRVAEELIFGREKVTSGAVVRHRAGHPAGAHDGDALGSVGGTRHRVLWREPGRGVPRHVGVAHPERVGSHGSEDRHRDPALRRRRLQGSDPHSHREACRPRDAGQGPARIRNAERRRDPAICSTARSRTANRCWSRPRRAPPRCRRPASRARVPIRTPGWSRSRRRKRLTTTSKKRGGDAAFFIAPQPASSWERQPSSFRGRIEDADPDLEIRVRRFAPPRNDAVVNPAPRIPSTASATAGSAETLPGSSPRLARHGRPVPSRRSRNLPRTPGW